MPGPPAPMSADPPHPAGAQPSGPRPLSTSVRVESGALVLTVLGDVGAGTVEQFRGVVEDVVAVGPARITVDLAGGDFLDASGPTVLLMTGQRLLGSGTRLSVRSAPAQFHRLFELNGLTGPPSDSRPTPTAQLGEPMAAASAAGQARDVLDAALRLVVTMAQAVVVGADGASITLRRHGRLATVAASNDVVLAMDQDQYATGEGPCLAAATEGERFHIDSLREETRWPAFVPRARARGIESILSTPLGAADRPVGALNIYSREIGAFAAHEKDWADQFAAEASQVMAIAAGSDRPSAEEADDQVRQALHSRETITLAQGMVMQRDGVSADAAYVRLRDLSRRTGRPLRDVCAELNTIRGLSGGDADGPPHS